MWLETISSAKTLPNQVSLAYTVTVFYFYPSSPVEGDFNLGNIPSTFLTMFGLHESSPGCSVGAGAG